MFEPPKPSSYANDEYYIARSPEYRNLHNIDHQWEGDDGCGDRTGIVCEGRSATAFGFLTLPRDVLISNDQYMMTQYDICPPLYAHQTMRQPPLLHCWGISLKWRSGFFVFGVVLWVELSMKAEFGVATPSLSSLAQSLRCNRH